MLRERECTFSGDGYRSKDDEHNDRFHRLKEVLSDSNIERK